jgi:endoglucanase
MTDGAPNYTIDPLLFDLLDEVVEWAEDINLYLILDNHSFDPDVDTDPDIDDILVPVWEQMADHYKNNSDRICYEILHEPHGISDEDWDSIQQTVIDAIRAIDQVHSIVVTPADYGNYSNLRYLSSYSDDNLIYTFHFYDPIIFTHQGADWTDPSLESLTDVPFPYLPEVMPELPSELKATWASQEYYAYNGDGTFWKVEYLIDRVESFQNSRNVPVFCGEFGVYKPYCQDMYRNLWHFFVRMSFESRGISWALRDYRGGFGLFEEGTSESFYYDLNIILVKLLGLYAPY